MGISNMKAAIIGCGVISDIYINSLQNKYQIIEVTACSDRNRDKMEKTAEKYGIRAMSFEEILEDESIEMIINLTSPAAHYEINKKALENRKHVFTEKMMAVELEEGLELCRLAKKNDVRLGAAPDTFLGGSIQTARYIVDHGLIGEPVSAVISLNRNFDVFADILPHLNKRGGTFPFDTGCYYLTALAFVLGAVKKVTALSNQNKETRIGKRVDKPWFGETMKIEQSGILTAAAEYENGVLCSIHFNSESILDEQPHLEIYGTEGILFMGDPNEFGSPVYLKKPMSETIQFPFTHGCLSNSRGVGAAEMAWAVRKNRPHRASMEMAVHILEIIHGMHISAESEKIYFVKSEFERPDMLPTGFIDNGFWGPTEESALI